MNTLPIQLTSAVNAAPDAASKGRAADAPDAESPFRQALKDEIAGRRQAEAGASSAAGKAEKSEPQPQAKAAAAKADQDRDETDTSAEAEALPADMAQYLVLTSQLSQQAANQDAASPRNAAEALPVDTAAIHGDANGTGLPLAAAQAQPKDSPVLQRDTGLQGDARTAADKNDFAAALDKSRLAQQAAGAVQDKGAQPGADVEALASSSQHAEIAADVQQPGMQAASFAALQQAGMDKLQGHGPSSDSIAPRVATPAWNHAVGQKVVWMVGNDQQSASLTLNPPDLGPLQVVISVSESTATANFVSAHPEVRQALENAMPRLREMLGEAGIQLGQASVGAGTSSDYGAWGQQQAAQSTPVSGESTFPMTPAAPAPARGQAIGRGLVDTFA